MTDDQMSLAIIRRVTSLPAGHPARHSAATALGVIPRKPSEDAGGPWHGYPSIAAEAREMGAISEEEYQQRQALIELQRMGQECEAGEGVAQIDTLPQGIAAEARAMGLDEKCPQCAWGFVTRKVEGCGMHCDQCGFTPPDSPVQSEVETSGGEWPQTNGEGA